MRHGKQRVNSYLALDDGYPDPRWRRRAQGQLAGTGHQKCQGRDRPTATASSPTCPSTPTMSLIWPAPAARALEDRERDLQCSENQGIQPRTQFRTRPKQPVRNPSHPQPRRLCHSHRRANHRRGLEPRHEEPQAPESGSSITCAP